MSVEMNDGMSNNEEAKRNVERAFAVTPEMPLNQRRRMAAFVLLEPLYALRDAKNEQMTVFENFTQSGGSIVKATAHMIGNKVVATPDITAKQNLISPEMDEAMDNVDKAEIGLVAATDQVQADYHLSRLQARIAKWMAKRKLL